jgi:hypothetical protein
VRGPARIAQWSSIRSERLQDAILRGVPYPGADHIVTSLLHGFDAPWGLLCRRKPADCAMTLRVWSRARSMALTNLERRGDWKPLRVSQAGLAKPGDDKKARIIVSDWGGASEGPAVRLWEAQAYAEGAGSDTFEALFRRAPRGPACAFSIAAGRSLDVPSFSAWAPEGSLDALKRSLEGCAWLERAGETFPVVGKPMDAKLLRWLERSGLVEVRRGVEKAGWASTQVLVRAPSPPWLSRLLGL